MPSKAQHDDQQHRDDRSGSSPMDRKMYLRFGAMILTAMVVMYAAMFAGTYEWGHVRFSESRVFMALTMGGTMGLVMLGWMLNMYRSTKANVAIVVASLVLLGVGVFLDRSQTTVQDESWMSSMIPHHSLAITRSERAEISDARVCELAVSISEAQRREIMEMDWLLDDIDENGVAATPEEAAARPVPEFDVSALRSCATD
ncbi:DUF305 domain-containing protein [Blastococcus sp. TF02A-30]|uniref:DUF305 domain-containing protein n=1 Tax=Blastococcus sp. TF02A-30 TaxID=2250580 RepID=UPI001F26E48B|nr:DUF305 domain-containing protein [Blastococcus sp. TF02A-30]